MDIDLPALLQPVSQENPAGPDLPYDPLRLEIELAFNRPFSIAATDHDMGEDAQTEDWREVVQAIVTLSGKTKDIWLPIFLARAGARWGQLEVVEVGSEALAGLIEQYWPTLHPALDEGVLQRASPCEILSNRAEFLGPLQRIPLISHPRFGAFSGSAIERFQVNGEAEEKYGFFRAALEDLGPEGLLATDARLARILAALARADAAFTGHAGADAPSFKPVVAALNALRKALRSFIPEDVAGAASGELEPGVQSDSDPAERSNAGSAPGRIDSREDVLRAMDAIIAYYRRREPSSPLPLVLERAKAWVTMPFMDMLMDIAPGSRDDLERVLLLSKNRGDN